MEGVLKYQSLVQEVRIWGGVQPSGQNVCADLKFTTVSHGED